MRAPTKIERIAGSVRRQPFAAPRSGHHLAGVILFLYTNIDPEKTIECLPIIKWPILQALWLPRRGGLAGNRLPRRQKRSAKRVENWYRTRSAWRKILRPVGPQDGSLARRLSEILLDAARQTRRL